MNRRHTDFIVVHCSATRPNNNIGFDEINSWHLQRGWSGGCGYHSIIRLDGSIEFGRHFDEPGAHVQGWNTRSVGVCLVGGLDDDGKPANTYSLAQMASLRSIVEMLERAYPEADVVGHRDLSPDLDGDGIIGKHEWIKDCPCFEVREWRAGWVS